MSTPSQNAAVISYAAVVEPTGTGPEKRDTSADSRPMSSDASRAYGRGKQVVRVRAAGFPRRALASSIDLALVTLATVAVAVAAAFVLGVRLPTANELGPDFVLAGLLDRNPMVAGACGLLFGMSALYQIYLGGILGQTLGKKLMGIRVLSSKGRAPGPLVASIRFLTMTLSLAPFGLGFLWCIFDRERRSLHDHLSGTYVVLLEE
jgi:uncharacterized RDD family membrane protein YckC